MVNTITILKYKMRPSGRNDNKLMVREINPHLLCVLCRGYFVEATSIVECLHSFCKSCIVKYIKTSRFCPICDVQLNRQDPLLSLKPDKILQRICYKIVPGLYKSEKLRRKDFSLRHNEAVSSEFSATYNQYFSYEDNISISLEYYDNK
uniref:Polycomb complex protein BMI-1 n=1 Tax=Cacopsylla melanoneura TaxID=428564 RepID=A0A8D8QX86_9HEMI